MKKKIKLLILFTAITFIFSLKPLFSADPQKVIKIMWWGTKERYEITQKVIQMFESKYPEIKIKIIYSDSYHGYFDVLNSLISKNEIPDIIQMAKQNFPEYLEKKIFTDLNIVKEIDKSDLDKWSLDAGTFNNKLYGITLGATAECYVYNKEFFDRANVAYPTEKWTWDDFERIATEIHKKLPDIWGANRFELRDFLVYLREQNESFYSNDLKSPGFREETFEKFASMGLRMKKSNVMVPIEIAKKGHQKTAMISTLVNYIVQLRKILNSDVELILYPGPNNEVTNIGPTLFFSIAESSKLKKEAGLFINYFVNDIEANEILRFERGISVNTKVRIALANTASTQEKKIMDYIAYLAYLSTKSVDKMISGKKISQSDAKCRTELEKALESVFYESATPKEAARRLIINMKDILNK
ncbi:MAG: carbohydrate ABC transporter substrate-binding protein [Fusobacteriaceae bacterium]|nr:carbohydrate ABC transporter substrate-binding protein [Fusobacteriaceae bacterium]